MTPVSLLAGRTVHVCGYLKNNIGLINGQLKYPYILDISVAKQTGCPDNPESCHAMCEFLRGQTYVRKACKRGVCVCTDVPKIHQRYLDFLKETKRPVHE